MKNKSVFNEFMLKKMETVSDKYSKEDYQNTFKYIDELFSMMASAYGGQWINNFESDTARDVWVAGLIDIKVEDIAKGFNNSLQECPDYPPNLPKFRDLCKRKEIKNGSELPLLSRSLLNNKGKE